jgi:hypothetical protein
MRHEAIYLCKSTYQNNHPSHNPAFNLAVTLFINRIASWQRSVEPIDTSGDPQHSIKR